MLQSWSGCSAFTTTATCISPYLLTQLDHREKAFRENIAQYDAALANGISFLVRKMENHRELVKAMLAMPHYILTFFSIW